LSGGELPAAVLMETVARLLPDVLGNEESKRSESFAAPDEAEGDPGGAGLLDFPQYTRPAEFRGLKTPEVLLSGNHRDIRAWRRRQALLKTSRTRPDLIGKAAVSKAELRAALQEAAFQEDSAETPVSPPAARG
ncbi:MAG: tRNA (guanosine(37)-N1)-methyltransferase TrmD, partial [Terriglobia bacterium]